MKGRKQQTGQQQPAHKVIPLQHRKKKKKLTHHHVLLAIVRTPLLFSLLVVGFGASVRSMDSAGLFNFLGFFLVGVLK